MSPRRGSGGGPRNFFQPDERRRLFLAVMPLAAVVVLGLGWLERSGVGPRGRGRQVDTRLAAVAGPQPAGDTVLIERATEPESPGSATAELGGSAEALAKVRDATFFREADVAAWLEIWQTLTTRGREGLRRAAPAEVSFGELFGQPRSFRGKPVRIKGTLRRLERLRAPANDLGITEYWQGWLEPAGGPPSPVVVHCLHVPAGMSAGMRIAEPVELVGYFLKNYAYNARDTIRVAPLVMALEPIRLPQPPTSVGSPGESVVGGVALVAMAVLVVAGGLAIMRPTRRRPPDTRLDPAVVGAEPVSVESAVAEFGRAARSADAGGSPEPPP